MIKLLDRNMDYGLVIAVLALMVIGVIMIHSASSGEHIDEYSNLWIKQLLWLMIAFFLYNNPSKNFLMYINLFHQTIFWKVCYQL